MEQPEGFEVAPKEHSLVQKWAVLPVLNPLQSWFWNREHESGTKGPSFSPGFAPGTKGDD